jgi:hypothetical protein
MKFIYVSKAKFSVASNYSFFLISHNKYSSEIQYKITMVFEPSQKIQTKIQNTNRKYYSMRIVKRENNENFLKTR